MSVTKDIAVDELKESAELGRDNLVTILSSLVATKSVNPGIYEAEMAAKCAEWLKPTGAEVTLVESMPDRPSVGAVLKGSGGGPALVLNGHIDTVPIDDPELWDTEPFTPTEKPDGFLYGRGSCDMKSGLTVQIAVAQHLARQGKLKGDLVLHFAMGEECAEPGTLSLIQAGFVGDVGITTEPTDLRVATAERGLAWFTIRVKGRSIHASRAHLGDNPNKRIPLVLEAVQSYENEISTREHPLCPGGSCTPTLIRAGVKENAVPDYSEVTVDRRLIPGESIKDELALLGSHLERMKERDPGFDFEVRAWDNAFDAAEIPTDSPFAAQMAATVSAVTGEECEIYGTPYSSDVRNLINDAGMEAITFGAGNVAECHCPNERVSVQQLEQAALSVAKITTDLLT